MVVILIFNAWEQTFEKITFTHSYKNDLYISLDTLIFSGNKYWALHALITSKVVKNSGQIYMLLSSDTNVSQSVQLNPDQTFTTAKFCIQLNIIIIKLSKQSTCCLLSLKTTDMLNCSSSFQLNQEDQTLSRAKFCIHPNMRPHKLSYSHLNGVAEPHAEQIQGPCCIRLFVESMCCYETVGIHIHNIPSLPP